MILRTIVVALGLTGALGAAQFPSFSQQYVQRLGGAVQALDDVVADFDASAARLDLTRTEALAQMHGTAFTEARRSDMERTFARHASLSDDLAALSNAGPLIRAYRVQRMTDAELARGTWQSFEPALPLTFASALFACLGFFTSVLSCRLVLRLCRPRRKRVAMPA